MAVLHSSAASMLYKFDAKINLCWEYFEANKGKGAVGEIAEAAKHAVYSYVLTKGVEIKSPRELTDHANRILPYIPVQYVDNDSMVLDHHNKCRREGNLDSWYTQN